MKKNLIYSFKNNRVLDSRAVYYNQRRIDKIIDGLMQELEDATATGESISVIDSANAPAKLLPSGNTYQATNIKTYTCTGEEIGDYYFTYNSINYQFTMPTIEEGSVLAFNTDTLKLYLGETEIATTTDNMGTLITLQDTPNPKYEQQIHVLKGHNEFLTQSKNLYDYENSRATIIYNSNATKTDNGFKGGWGYYISLPRVLKPGTYTLSFNVISGGNSNNANLSEVAVNGTAVGRSINIHQDGKKEVTFTINKDVNRLKVDNGNSPNTTLIYDIQIEQSTTATSYGPHEEQILELDLPEGMEMCKTSDYADTFEWQDGKWYKNKKIQKRIFEGGDDENWGHFSVAEGDLFRLPSINDGINDRSYVPYCDLYKGIPLSQKSSRANYNFYIENQNIDIIDNRFNTTSAFKANLTTNNISVYYPLQTSTLIEITDSTLISQLNAMQKVLSYYGGTNITTISAEDLNPILNFDYKKSNRLRDDNQDKEIENIKARLDLLEG